MFSSKKSTLTPRARALRDVGWAVVAME